MLEGRREDCEGGILVVLGLDSSSARLQVKREREKGGRGRKAAVEGRDSQDPTSDLWSVTDEGNPQLQRSRDADASEKQPVPGWKRAARVGWRRSTAEEEDG